MNVREVEFLQRNWARSESVREEPIHCIDSFSLRERVRVREESSPMICEPKYAEPTS